jgi:hypothetical protein
MKCVILQPSYLPWRGYFHQIREADVFVFYDDVQYDKGGWRNRNRVKAPGGSQWLTIPVRHKGTLQLKTKIEEIEICWARDWPRKHAATLRQLYSAAPHFERYSDLLEGLFSSRPTHLADFTIETTRALAEALGIGDTRFLRASSIPRPSARKTEDLLAILVHLGADEYISGPSARSYLDEPRLEEAGVRVRYMDYDYPDYPQLHPPFDPHVSIVDLLFMTGPQAPDYIWRGSA